MTAEMSTKIVRAGYRAWVGLPQAVAAQVDTARPGMDSTNSKTPEAEGSLMHEPLWTVVELTRYLGCSDRQTLNLRLRGLPFVRVGSLVRFMPREVAAWLRAGRTGGTGGAASR